jgi:hypothetical protein
VGVVVFANPAVVELNDVVVLLAEVGETVGNMLGEVEGVVIELVWVVEVMVELANEVVEDMVKLAGVADEEVVELLGAAALPQAERVLSFKTTADPAYRPPWTAAPVVSVMSIPARILPANSLVVPTVADD